MRLAGWVAAKRDHGGLLFVDLREPGGVEPGGLVQLVGHPGQPAFEVLAHLRVESVISVSGQVAARPPETVNPKLETGAVEVVVEDVEVLSAAEVLPFPVEKETEVGEESRLRYRYLDLRRGPLLQRLAARARLAGVVRDHMAGRGFLEVQTPVLTASSPEGARDFLVPSRLYPGEFYALPQAPQQFKQLLMVGGIERYFQIAPCFRDEASRADRSPGEFYQIDLEMAFATQEDVFAEVELLMARIVAECSAKRAPAEFPRLRFAEAIDRFGTDKPDLRFGLEIADVTAGLGGRRSCRCLLTPRRSGHVIRVLRAPEAPGRPRRWFDAFADSGRAGWGGGGLAPAGPWRRDAGVPGRKLTPAEASVLVSAADARPGDAVLCAVGRRDAAAALLGRAAHRPGPGVGAGRSGGAVVLLGGGLPHVRAQTPTPAPGTSPTTRSRCPRAAWRR